MTISTTDARVSYDGDGATTAFPIPFKFIENGHIKATLRDVSGGETTWTLGTEFTLSGAGEANGGTLTVVTSPTDFTPLTDEKLVIELDIPNTQGKAFPLGGAFPSTQVEEALDLGAQRDALLAQFDQRVISVPTTDAQVGNLELAIDSLRVGKYLGFDALGQPQLLAGTAEAADLSDKTVLPTGAGEARSIADLFGLGALTAENVKLYGAKGDLAELADGTVTDGSAVLSSASVTFDSADVGKAVWVEAAETTGKAITAIANGPVDAAYQSDETNGVFVDVTDELVDATAADIEPFPTTEAVGDRFYIGHIQTFDEVSITISTSGVGGVVQWKYWDGTTWANLTVTDNTNGFTAAPGTQTVTFTPPVDWATRQLNPAFNGRLLYYIAAEVTTVYSTNPVLSQGVLSGGRIRMTSVNHQIEPLQTVSIKGVVGTTEANGTFQVERIDNDFLDLIGPSFQNAYVSGGTIHGRLETTIASVSGGDATLAASAGASVAGAAVFGYGTDDTAAFQAAVDTGKAVVVPDGNYLVSKVTIQTDRQKMIGMGGRIATMPKSLSSAGNSDGLIMVEADFVEITGLYLDNPTEAQRKAASWPTALRYGIRVRGQRANIHHNAVRRFQHGISVNFNDGFFTGPEFGETIIIGNIVWENLGAGSGRDQKEGNQGESEGDGINSWGSNVIIANNIVHVKEGQDARIAIHVEALGDRYDPANPVALYPDAGAVIQGNIIIGHDMRFRNGRWRRGIVTEGVQQVAINGNVIYGGGWWAIAVAMGAGGPPSPAETFEGKGNVSIASNTIWWTRPNVDRAGADFSPSRSAIAVFSNTSDTNKGVANVSVQGNTIEIFGWANDGILVSAFVSGGRERTVSIGGNSIRSQHGRLAQFIRTILGCDEVVVVGNSCRGNVTGAGFRFQNSAQFLLCSSNVIHCLNADATNNGEGILTAGSSTHSQVFIGNIIRGFRRDAIQAINADEGVTVLGNVMKDIGDDGIDGFGSANKVLVGNVFLNIGNLYTRNWTPGATIIDADNVKN